MHKRALALTAALALAFSALSTAPAAADGHLGDTYVAIGDSEAAGTGNKPYVDESCLRSAKSYPMLLAAMTGGVESNACAGATTLDVLTTQLGDIGPATQLVTITAGVNNIGWQDVLLACSSAGSDVACATELAAANQDALTISPGIAQLIVAVRTMAPQALIVVTGYPLLFKDNLMSDCNVGAFQGGPVKFSAMQTTAVNAGLAGVNTAIEMTVEGYTLQTGDPGVVYVDVDAAFDGHALCDTGDRWISGLSSGKGTADRGFHPNAAGQQAYAAAIAAAIAPLMGG
ncbi:hypothetical protein ASD56_05420 [Microbacterium sp. Root166]|uniref:SGNH/GDSL hydrolase family protein n=1 Tax=Microbacterium sp. Root166 TaxID=1736478 RepID=UPI0006F86496|nr:SGNH/GDSL hydrolase family protein [Microbacterium sp. Root166]KQZ85732.1 hypothetical protein ASD56_05420 [Microbacterium sp. Root166]